MSGYLIDSCVILDLVLDDPEWAEWSEETLSECSVHSKLFINPIIYTEVSIGFERIEELESILLKGGFEMLHMPREALFLAGKVFLKHRKRKGVKRSPLPDFYIGAHAAVQGLTLVTRDQNRFKTGFPTLDIVHP